MKYYDERTRGHYTVFDTLKCGSCGSEVTTSKHAETFRNESKLKKFGMKRRKMPDSEAVWCDVLDMDTCGYCWTDDETLR